MTAIDTGGSRQWGIGSVFSTTFSIFFGHFVSFVGTALLILLPSLLFRLAVPISLFQTILDLFLGQVISVTLIYGTMQALRGRKVAIGECLSEGIKRLGTALVVAILAWIAYIVGFVLLIVPGIILMLMWLVAVPAAVVEKTGVSASFARSSALTRDRRWRILGIVVLAGVMLIAVNLIVMAAVGAGSGGSFTTFMTRPTATLAVVRWIVGSLGAAFFTCLLATLYYALRSDKEGVDINQIASVFD